MISTSGITANPDMSVTRMHARGDLARTNVFTTPPVRVAVDQ